MAKDGQYASDRYITPGVIVAFILAATVVVVGLGGAVTWLTAQGIDAGPIVQLVGVLTAAVSALGTFVLQLVGRTTATKTEASVGRLANGVGQVATVIDSRLPPTAPGPPTASGPTAAVGPPTAQAPLPPASYGITARSPAHAR